MLDISQKINQADRLMNEAAKTGDVKKFWSMKKLKDKYEKEGNKQ